METFFIKVSLWMALIAWVHMHGYKGCLETERTALLELKAFFKSLTPENADNILTSWIDDPMSDCCGWERIKCNGSTGQAVELSLSATNKFLVSIEGDGFPLLNLSLFCPFEALQSLDLSFNFWDGFSENRGSDGIGCLKNLKSLNLGSNFLNDSSLPYLISFTSLETLKLHFNTMADVFKSDGGLGDLRNLELLDLSSNRVNGSPSSHELLNLERLKFLDLSDNMMSGSLANLGLCKLKNLIELDLSQNKFDGQLPLCLSNLTYLKAFDLSSNKLSGNLPSVIANISSLEYLSLSNNNFEGLFSFHSLVNHSKLQIFLLSNNLLQVENVDFPPLPTYQLKVLQLSNCSVGAIPNFLLNQYDLRHIDLSHNKIVGNFPTWLLQNNTKLEALYLMNNAMSGILQLPNSRSNLLHLDISINNFSDKLPSSIGKILPELLDLQMSENSFKGNLPFSMGEMKKLQSLDLSNNNFSGELPRKFITGCFTLSSLTLSNNNFQGKVFPEYMNLTQLKQLYLDNNHFSGKIHDGLLKATLLSNLDVSNNMLSGQIPYWFGNLSKLLTLSMSNNFLEGNITLQFSNLRTLYILDISENNFFGFLNISTFWHLYINNNAFNGSMANVLLRSSALVTLDLRNNELSGSIPDWINEHSNLQILLLKGNSLQGHIPDQLCLLQSLRILDLSYNKLKGSIPACFTTVTSWMQEYHEKLFQRGFTYYFEYPSFSYYNSILELSHLQEKNQVSGQRKVEFMTKNRYEFYEGDILNYMTGLDLSCNKLTGGIPSEIGNLREIRALNLSHNFFSSCIPENFCNLKMIESLDLSHNELRGQIPPRLIELNFLSNFNVSYNKLSGPIPNAGQFASFDESNYAGNPYLCGPTINKSCTSLPKSPSTPFSGAEEDESIVDMVAFRWTFVASYVTVVVGLFTILWLSSYWRRLWLYFIDACIDSCLYWLSK